MAFPSRFGMSHIPQTAFVPVYGTAQMIPIVPTTAYLVPAMPGGVITSVNFRGPGNARRPLLSKDPRYQAPAVIEKTPPTTVFIGNITEKASNELIKAMLAKCGTILQWKRVQGSTGKFQAFGFCEYDHPYSALRAVRLLHEWKLGDKSLTVKVDEKTKEFLRDYVNKRRQAQGKPPLKFEGDQLPCDEDMQREDEAMRRALRGVMEELGPDLVEGNEGTVKPRTPELYGKGGNLDIGSLDRERKEYIAREINSFRKTYIDDGKDSKSKRHHQRDRHRHHKEEERPTKPDTSGKRSESPATVTPQQPANIAPVKSRPESRSSTTGGRARSPSPSESLTGSQATASKIRRRDSSPDGSVSKSNRGQKRSRSRSRLESDEDDDKSIERRRLERKVREKEASYLERLNKWENRERKRAREYERDRLKQKVLRREEIREAKKLKEFLEDYDDERDDPKYYRGKSYDLRRRDYEKERESDNQDRQKEKEELEEIKKRLLEDGVADPEEEIARLQRKENERLSRRFDAGDSSESPSPVHEGMGRQERRGGSDENAYRARSGSRQDYEEEGDARSASDDSSRRRGKYSAKATDKDSPDGDTKKSRFAPATTDAAVSRPLGFAGLKLSHASAPSVTGGNMAEEGDEEEENKKSNSRRLVPLDYTEEEKMAVGGVVAKKQLSKQSGSDNTSVQPSTPHTPDEKKKLIKRIIEKIPTVKEELFAYAISWNQVDQALIDRRIKPWVTKKIVEYIGEDEPSLVEFICQKISQKTPPQTIVDDISMVLDEEAGVFVVKLWRLLIYEIEAKKVGLVKMDIAT